jgi:polysaccharide deacetylase family protein (PEP-CTERM system associated)
MSITNAISIDVEDYFQVSAFENTINRGDWGSLEHRVEKNMRLILDLLNEKQVKGTFFVLGWIAERYPDIVKSIISGGHELASHGYGHQRVRDLTPEQFRDDVSRAKSILEDISGLQIKGYRAPSYSIGKENIWALDVLAQTGHIYSSSIYPIQHDHYGFPEAPRFIFRDKRTGLIEIPITTVKVLNRLRPAGGGGFFRFYPYKATRWLIQQVNQIDMQSAVFYMHPWEIDPGQPRQKNISLKTRFRHYLNLDKTEGRFTRLLEDFSWGRMDDVFLGGADIPDYPLS